MKKNKTFIRVFGFMNKRIYLYFLSAAGMGLTILMFQIFLSNLFKNMFNAIAELNFNSLVDTVKYNFIYLLILMVPLALFFYLSQKTIVLTTANIRKSLFAKLAKLPVVFFKDNHSGDVISRMTNDVSEMEKVYSDILLDFIIGLIGGIGAVIYISFLDYRLLLVTVFSAFLTVYINIHYAKILRILGRSIQDRLARLNESLTNILDGVQIIRVFNLHKVIMDLYKGKSTDTFTASMERVRKQSVIDGLNEVSMILNFLGVVIVGALLTILLGKDIGISIAAVQMQNSIMTLVRSLGSFQTSMQTSLAASDRVFEIFDEEEEPRRYELAESEEQSDFTVEFQNVSFCYQEENVLKNLSFKVPKGKAYALVGPSGSGKSTVFKLILNFYKPDGGNLFINGISIQNQDIADIRKLIAYVPQDAYLFTGTVAENIAHGKAKASMENIIEAAKAANAHEFIMKMPEGYMTLVGEKGAALSGGQRQRIAIARAIMKNAPILLLDEATSALDTESEALVQEALNKLSYGKTTLVIAHRLSTIQNAHQILVLKDGCIIESGTHAQLLASSGVYKSLYEMQFA